MSYSKAQQAELDELDRIEADARRIREQYERDNKLFFFNTPVLPANPLQAELLEAWDDPENEIFTYTGANRMGKCLSYSSEIDTPSGKVSIGKLFENKKSFKVYAWDGKKKVIANASAPFKKAGLHKCYRIKMSDGAILEAADHHRILTTLGWTTTDELYTYFSSLRESSSVPYWPARASGVERSKGIRSNFPDCYFANHDLCGEQPLSYADIYRGSFPSQGDALKYNQLSCSSDDLEHKRTNIPLTERGRHSNMDGLILSAVRCVGFLYRIFGKILSFFYEGFRLFQKPSNAGVFGFQSDPSTVRRRQLVSWSCSVPFEVMGDNKIESITPISACQEVYDFHVPRYKNYFAGGIIHHNTTTVVVISESVMFGKWLWDGRKVYIHPRHPAGEPRKVRIVGQDWEKHIKTVLIPTLRMWWPKDRAVKIKKNSLGVESLWTDVQTGSTLEIMSNRQESDLHEGWWGDLVAYDEPPKQEVRIANRRGLTDWMGRELFAATLLKEAWIHHKIIKRREKDGTPSRKIYNVHGDIWSNVGFGLSKEGVDSFAEELDDADRDARIHGIPSYMSGLVLPQFKRKLHLVDRFPVPTNWMIDIAIDVHPRERQAVLFIATDEKGYRYVVNEIWGHGDGKWIGDNIVRCVRQNAYRVNRVIIDPLAKGDANQDITTYETIARVLMRHKMMLEVASKDKENGILFIKDHLVGPNNKPSLFFFRDLARTIFEVESWMYDEKSQKPKKKDDHFCENLYRVLLLDTKYYEPEDEEDEEIDRGHGRNKTTGY